MWQTIINCCISIIFSTLSVIAFGKIVTKQKIKLEKKMDTLEIGASLDLIFDVLRRSNKFIDESEPWVLAKDESKKDRLETVLYNLLESIRVCGILLKPFIPDTSDKIKIQINNTKEDLKYLEDNTYEVGTPEALFMRIDKDKLLSELDK